MNRTAKIALGVILFGILGLVGVVGLVIYSFANREKSPAREKFDIANRYIILKKTGSPACYGNTPQAQTLAEAYSKVLKEKCAKEFTGGRKDGGPTFTGGEFLVYCQQTPTVTAFLVHVPDFDLYHGDALDVLADLAWENAQELIKKDPKMKLGVGLRGAVFYGPVWIGTGDGIADEEGSGVRGLHALYPLFDPALNTVPAAGPPPPTVPAAPQKPIPPPSDTKLIPPPKNF